MDVNAKLTELRALIAQGWASGDHAERICELITALDESITRGGFMPSAWNRDEYNGHVNRETWAAGLHLSNDESIYAAARAAIRERVRSAFSTWSLEAADFTATVARSYAGDACQEYVEGVRDDATEGRRVWGMPHREVVSMLTDVGSLWRVDWRSVSESLVDDDELTTLVAELKA